MLMLSSTELIAKDASAPWKEFTRYFSGFPLISLDQEIVCFHKKKITTKCWKDIGSSIEVFRCRKHCLRPDVGVFAVTEKCGVKAEEWNTNLWE